MLFKPEETKIKDEGMKPFIDPQEIWDFLNNAEVSENEVRRIIKKSLNKERLTLKETAVLLKTEDKNLIEEIKEGARELKRNVYGNRIVLFAPLYIGNECTNNCAYCGFRTSNKGMVRKTLSDSELETEIKALEDSGQKRLILVYGEHPKYSPEYIAHTVKLAYSVKHKKGEIRRVNINAAPLDIDGYKIVKDAGIGTYQVFQETYHPETYDKVHISGQKKDFNWRLTALDRAQEAGIDDVGIGVLFGLYDWRYEVMALVRHTLHFEMVYGVGPHTISFPRLKETFGGLEINRDHEVSDDDFLRLVAILRLAVPYTGMILTAREPVHIRQKVLEFGVSQIDGGSRIELGGYSDKKELQEMNREQFELGDIRPLDDIIAELLENGYIPSFCTSCYRLGRTGEHFMEFSVPGFIKRYCTPNAVLTLAEYLEDYASDRTKKLGYELIEKEIKEMEEAGEERTEALRKKLENVRKYGKRDEYF